MVIGTGEHKTEETHGDARDNREMISPVHYRKLPHFFHSHITNVMHFSLNHCEEAIAAPEYPSL